MKAPALIAFYRLTCVVLADRCANLDHLAVRAPAIGLSKPVRQPPDS